MNIQYSISESHATRWVNLEASKRMGRGCTRIVLLRKKQNKKPPRASLLLQRYGPDKSSHVTLFGTILVRQIEPLSAMQRSKFWESI